jgi:hypothetical protein
MSKKSMGNLLNVSELYTQTFFCQYLAINKLFRIMDPIETKRSTNMAHVQRKNLLTISTNAKTVKGEKLGILTGVLYLAPADVSGYEVCPKASAGCKAACLYTAGLGVMAPVVAGRINRTLWLHEDRDSFMDTLVADIQRLIRKAARKGMVPAVRLNGTSDIAWEKYRVTVDGVNHRNLMVAFPDLQFYDYTKIRGRKSAIALPNYHLTFSLAEDNDTDAFMAIREGYNVAVVMNLRKKDAKPSQWMGFPVVDGDTSDVRFFDPNGGAIVALTAKGKARYDTSGFVRDANLIARKAA